MASYILRDIDPELWKRVKAKAATQGQTVKDMIQSLLRADVGDK